MAKNDSNPDFGWLQQEMDSGHISESRNGDSSTSLEDRKSVEAEEKKNEPLNEQDSEQTELKDAPEASPPPAAEAAPESGPGNDSPVESQNALSDDDDTVFDSLDNVPPPVKNASDGSTTVLSDPPPTPDDLTSPDEETSPQAEPPVAESAPGEPVAAMTESADENEEPAAALSDETDAPQAAVPEAAPEDEAPETKAEEQPQFLFQPPADVGGDQAPSFPTFTEPGTTEPHTTEPESTGSTSSAALSSAESAAQSDPPGENSTEEQSDTSDGPAPTTEQAATPETAETTTGQEEPPLFAPPAPESSQQESSALPFLTEPAPAATVPAAASQTVDEPPPDAVQPTTEAGSSNPPSGQVGKPLATSSAPARKQNNLLLIIVASYASAVTIALLFLLFSQGSSANPHYLESLPDVSPESIDNLSYVPVNAPLAPGHTLKIGEKQRYGNILVEPLRIVREPIEFTHYSGDASRTRPNSKPVWKLWIRFTNVSDQQEIAPLDRNLLLRWVVKAEHLQEFSNYYIAEQGADKGANVISSYRLPATSDWDMKGQQLGKVLKPGESVETYIATSEEGLDSLSGPLVWRFQFRKGFGPAGNGVTTMVEVNFDKNRINGQS